MRLNVCTTHEKRRKKKLDESSVRCIIVICFRTVLHTVVDTSLFSTITKPFFPGLLLSKSTCYCLEAYQFEYILRFYKNEKMSSMCTFFPHSRVFRIADLLLSLYVESLKVNGCYVRKVRLKHRILPVLTATIGVFQF